jgi:hypothetical protein
VRAVSKNTSMGADVEKIKAQHMWIKKKIEFTIESYQKAFRRFRDVRSSYNPLFSWIILIWIVTKVIQWCMQIEKTVWETGWNWFLDFYGKIA